MSTSLVQTKPHIPRAHSSALDVQQAVAELKAQMESERLNAVLFFSAPDYDWNELANELNGAFDCPVFGCTTAGEIEVAYNRGGIVAVGLPEAHFNVHVRLIDQIDQFGIERGNALRASIEEAPSRSTFPNTLGFLLIDGLSVLEEQVVATVYSSFEGMQIIGGSSGDNLAFEKTGVFAEGNFHSNAAVLAVIETNLAFETFKFQHFEPTENDLIITEAEPARRIVYEIDGGVAAEEYAALLGLEIDSLDSQVFSRYPLMLQIGEEWYVRSIQKMNPDGSLTFYCAIDEGLPLTIAQGKDFVQKLSQQLDTLHDALPEVVLTIGCDCILRRLEIEKKEIFTEVESALAPFNFVGFSTYGEQFNSIHVNQTLTGVAFGFKA